LLQPGELERITVQLMHNVATGSVCSLSQPKSDISDYGHSAESFVHPKTCVLQGNAKKARISAHRPGQL
jgi:hypothetical protein